MPWGTSITTPAPPFGTSGLRTERDVFTYKHVFAVTEQSCGEWEGSTHVRLSSAVGHCTPAQHLQQLVKLLMNFCNHLANPGGSLEIHFSDFCHSRRLLETQNRICPGPLQPLLRRGESRSRQTLGTALAQTDRTKGEKHSAQCSLFYPFSSNSAPLPLT